MELRRYLSVVRKYLWPILLIVAVGAGVAFYFAFTAPPRYRATATLEISLGADPLRDPLSYTSVWAVQQLTHNYAAKIESPQVMDEVETRLGLVEMEGEPIEYTPGVAGEFLSRRSVNFHDRTRGSGGMQGYAMTHFQYGSVYSRFEGERDGNSKITTGTWKTYKGTGKLADIKGQGTFKVTAGETPTEWILDMEGEYEL